jgi:hypothetical protein
MTNDLSNDHAKGSEPFVAKPLSGVSDVAAKPDQVGFRNPPTPSRFKKGRSGNPKGRPKAAAISDVAPLLESIFAEPMKIREGDRERIVSTLEATLHAQIERALDGKPKAIRSIFNRAEKAGLFSKAQMKSFIELTEPQGEAGEIIRVYHAEKARQAATAGSAENVYEQTDSNQDH